MPATPSITCPEKPAKPHIAAICCGILRAGENSPKIAAIYDLRPLAP